MYYMGIDCGTQGTKAVIFDLQRGNVIAKGYSKHDIIYDDDGRREQNAEWWIRALHISIKEALAEAGIDGRKIAGLAVSGQQHGLVLLDEEGNVLRNAILWNDTSTASHNADIIASLGCINQVWKQLNTTFPVGFTASKVRSVLTQEPKLYEQVKHILLPHDYINFYLTGNYFTEGSEASGTGYYDVKSGSYSKTLMHLIDPSGRLQASVPPIKSWEEVGGTLRTSVARELGLSEKAFVACGGGDNTISAVGTGSIIEGTCTLSLGTSGTVCIQSKSFGSNIDPLLQIYNFMEERWLITCCTLNATSATASIQKMFDLSIQEFDSLIDEAEIGCEGLQVIPYFNGERMPPLPSARGKFNNLTNRNLHPKNVIRATAESVIFTLKWGFDKMSRSFNVPGEMIITGGGGNSTPWRQIVADVFNMNVRMLQNDEGGALGAALQAIYLHQILQGHKTSLESICSKYIQFDDEKTTHPLPGKVKNINVFIMIIFGKLKVNGKSKCE